MMRQLLYIFSCWLLIHAVGYAQDSTKVVIDGGLQLHVDYGKLAASFTDFESKWEVGVSYQFSNRFMPYARYGSGVLEPTAAIENGTYKSEGQYWRAGVNYLLPIDRISSLYIGAGYGQSSFEDSGTYEITSELWAPYAGSFERTGLTADWIEVNFGSEKILKDGHFILGFVSGARIINERSEEDFIDIYAIPGYGLALDEISPFFNLYVKYQF